MIYDCFSFFNELDLLELRLNELHDVVDVFVVVEATRTHTGKYKPLYYQMNHPRFKKFHDQIIHIIVEDMPMTPEEIQNAISPQDRIWLDTGYQLGDNWVRERYQRNQIMRALGDCCPDDIIIIEDADELVKHDIIADLENIIVDGSNAVEQVFHTYYMNWKCINMTWAGSKILRRKFVTNPSEHRFHTPAANIILNGGQHFNFMGGAEAIKNKINAYAHQEFAIPDVLNNIEQRLYLKQDVLGRLYKYEVVPIDDSYPKYLRDNLWKFDKYIYKGE